MHMRPLPNSIVISTLFDSVITFLIFISGPIFRRRFERLFGKRQTTSIVPVPRITTMMACAKACLAQECGGFNYQFGSPAACELGRVPCDSSASVLIEDALWNYYIITP